MYLFLFLFFSLIFTQPILAQTAVPTKTSSKEVLDMVEKKVQDMLEQSGTGTSTTPTNIPKAIVGTITQVNDSKITITNQKNENTTISITNETVFIDTKKNKIKSENLKSGQVILAMGYYDQYNNFETKRLIVTSTEAITNKNEIIFGQIADISQTSNVLVLIPIKNKNTQYQIKTDSKTEFVDQNGISLTIDKIKSGQKVIVIIQPDSKTSNTFDASKIITLSSSAASPTPTLKK